MPDEPTQGLALETAHVLFVDVVGYSRLPVDRQTLMLRELNDCIRRTAAFTRAAAHGEERLILLPTGDGMALSFFGPNPLPPIECAVEISRALRNHRDLKLRMGVHSGPVYRFVDINGKTNIAGGGINLAQRVMDCGDAGHILLSATVAEVLLQLSRWAGMLQELGEAEVKHAVRVRVYNCCGDDFGNPVQPEKLRHRQPEGEGDTRPESLSESPGKRRSGSSRRVWAAAAVAALVGILLALKFATAVRTDPEPFEHVTNKLLTVPFQDLAVRQWTIRNRATGRLLDFVWIGPNQPARHVLQTYFDFLTAGAATADPAQQIVADLQRALQRLVSGEYEQALAAVALVLRSDPQHPLGQQLLQALNRAAESSATKARNEAIAVNAVSLDAATYREGTVQVAEAERLRRDNNPTDAIRAYWKAAVFFDRAAEQTRRAREHSVDGSSVLSCTGYVDPNSSLTMRLNISGTDVRGTFNMGEPVARRFTVGFGSLFGTVSDGVFDLRSNDVYAYVQKDGKGMYVPTTLAWRGNVEGATWAGSFKASNPSVEGGTFACKESQ